MLIISRLYHPGLWAVSMRVAPNGFSFKLFIQWKRSLYLRCLPLVNVYFIVLCVCIWTTRTTCELGKCSPVSLPSWMGVCVFYLSFMVCWGSGGGYSGVFAHLPCLSHHRLWVLTPTDSLTEVTYDVCTHTTAEQLLL